ncbi:MAG: hypothetical protein K8W52_44775 [Deltaproteobacteria bacterium]|nr:hypothetical protein [Deltaproteobacteria bacterium]
MIALPAALAPWAAELAILPLDLALALAPWVGRLALATGPLSDSRTSHADAPDGYAGLTRRGSYERLLIGEWGLAEEFPDEFLRRAAGGEHLFLDLARRGPRGALRSVAIVSAGPSQLGAPRLAHLAALIVLARRATAAGASFAWGVLEDPDRALHEGLDAAGIRRLLDARTARTATGDAIAGWHAALASDRGLDWWCVGGAADTGAAARLGAAVLTVEDLLAPGARALDLTVVRGRRGLAAAPARLRLELPAPEVCARLLRDPLGSGAGARTMPEPSPGAVRDLRFLTGRKLMVRYGPREIERWPIPNSPNATVGRPKRWRIPDERQLVAMGSGRRAMLAVLARADREDELEVIDGAQPGVSRIAVPEGLRVPVGPAPDAARLGVVALVPGAKPDTQTLLVELAGGLVAVDDFGARSARGRVQPAVALAGVGVNATWAASDTFSWARIDGVGDLHIQTWSAAGAPSSTRIMYEGEPVVRFGFRGAFAVRQAPGTWDVREGTAAPVRLQTDLPVVGAGVRRNGAALLVREGHQLSWIHVEGKDRLLPARQEITTVAMCPDRHELAWATRDGEVIIYDDTRGAVLFRRGGKVAT